MATNFIKSPAEVETHRKVDLKDAPIKEETKGKFSDLCNQFDSIFSKGSGDIGKTLLVEMDIDTGNSPPIASRPYTLPLKHYESGPERNQHIRKSRHHHQEHLTMGITRGHRAKEICSRSATTEEDVC